MIRILIIEDEIIIARFIEKQVKQSFDCTVNLAITVSDARNKMEQFRPHLVLCDVNLKENISGIDLVISLKQHYDFEVIYITSYHHSSYVDKAASTNPANYLVKPIDETQLQVGLQLVMHKLKKAQAAAASTGASSLKQLLSPYELSIVRMIGQKKTTQEIAQAMHASPYTIKNKRHAICRKLDLPDKNNALLEWALHHRTDLERLS
ncbi:MAG: response regulator [Candidatus Pseudobacter hemicellulosilyticus]|uniref:Response regulator n=1 Tax=Candidatus Pseudobacter hemicellulosilyticus TaxID=3121375 RepID=A0AAJ5WSN0_9BACT|nr:MAG: response regulator [Pseudobacter sp.]